MYILHRMYVLRGWWARPMVPVCQARLPYMYGRADTRVPSSSLARRGCTMGDKKGAFPRQQTRSVPPRRSILKNAPPPTTRQARLPYGSSHRQTGSIGLALAAAAPCALRSGPVARCSCLQAHPRRTPQRRCGARGRLRHRTCIGCDGRAVPSWTAAGRFRRRRECTSPPAQGDRVDCDHRCRLRRNAH